MPASAEEIAQFREFSGDPSLPDIVASQYLDNSGGIEQAIGKYYDNSTLYTVHTYQNDQLRQQQQKAWDEGAFSQDRSGEDQMGAGIPAFQIHAADDSMNTLRPTANSNAPTRPPSRISMRDGQESGVLGSSGSPFIGPATRDHYDPSQWALVPTTSAAEILLDPDPDERRRDISTGEPVFMKPLANKDPLASVITILGHIPLARSTLVCPDGPTIDNYGSNPEWWKGARIELTSIIHTGSPQSRPSYELVEETQRLVAFMHSSTRSYGSVQSLSELKALTAATAGEAKLETLAVRFLAAWSNMGMELTLFSTDLFLTTALHIGANNGKEEKIPFYVIDIKLDKDSISPARTLYDGADATLWGGDPDGTSDDNYCLETIPPVLFMHVQNQDASKTGLDMDVPHTWYLDRYLQKNMFAAKVMRNERFKYKRELQNIEERRQKFLRVKHPKNEKMLETKELIRSTINYLNPPKPVEKGNAKSKENEKGKENEKPGQSADKNHAAPAPEQEPAPTPEPPSPEQRRSVRLAKQLESILEQVDRKLKDLDSEREQTQAAMAELSKLFTDPSSTEDCPKHRYNLRGVSIGPDHFEQFVLVDPATKHEVEQHEDDAIDVEAPSQWWRIHYHHNQFQKQPTEIDTVLDAASNKTRDVMLVYATDAACERREIDLNEALKQFVAKDNELFSEEVAEHLQKMEPQYGEVDLPPAYSENPMSPHDGRWVHNSEPISSGFISDPGPSVLSDDNYRYNTDASYNPHARYANAYTSTSATSAWDEDVRMGGIAAVERIEDVTDEDVSRLPNKGG